MSVKSSLKWVKSLQVKKYRQAEQCFLVQGAKGVSELLASDFQVELVLATADAAPDFDRPGLNLIQASPGDLESLGSFQSNDQVLAVARMREARKPVPGKVPILMLDDIRDPGNLGTILRTADWFGVREVVVSLTTVDFYNPKVISATMGSFTRVNVFPCDLTAFLQDVKVPVAGAFLNGEPLAQADFGSAPVVVVGNESHGISEAVSHYVTKRITIPGSGQTESLNAAVATGIFLYAMSTGVSTPAN